MQQLTAVSTDWHAKCPTPGASEFNTYADQSSMFSFANLHSGVGDHPHANKQLATFFLLERPVFVGAPLMFLVKVRQRIGRREELHRALNDGGCRLSCAAAPLPGACDGVIP